MNEEYLLGAYENFGGQDTLGVDYNTWVGKIKDNEVYKKGMFESYGGQEKLKSSYEDWNTAVFVGDPKKKDLVEPTSDAGTIELDLSQPQADGFVELPKVDSQAPTVENLEKSQEKTVLQEQAEALQPVGDIFESASQGDIDNFNTFEELNNLSDEELAGIDNQITEEKQGKFGVLKSIQNVFRTSPSFGALPNPFFDPSQSAEASKKDDLIKSTVASKQQDFIRNLEGDQQQNLTSLVSAKKFRDDTKLNVSQVKIEKINTGLVALDNNLQKINGQRTEIQDRAKEIETEVRATGPTNELMNEFDNLVIAENALVEQSQDLRTGAVTLFTERTDELNEIEATETNIGTFNQELDLLKRNYSFIDNITDRARIGFAETFGNFQSGLQRNELKRQRRTLKAVLSNGLENDPTYSDDVPAQYKANTYKYSEEEFDAETEGLVESSLKSTFKEKDLAIEAREALRPKLRVDQISSFGDVVDFTVDGLSENASTLTQLAIPYFGQTMFVLGQKEGNEIELRKERHDNQQALSGITKQLKQEGLPEERKVELIKEKDNLEASLSTQNDLSDSHYFWASSGMAVSELIFSRMFGEVKRLNIGARILREAGNKTLNRAVGSSVKEITKATVNTLRKEGGAVLKDAAEEGFLDEWLTTITQNGIKMFVLNDANTQLFDDSFESIAGGLSVGGAMSVSPRVAGQFINHFSNKDRRNKVYNNVKQITEFQKYLDDNPDLDRGQILTIQGSINTLLEDNKNIIKSTSSKFDNLSLENKAELLKVSSAYTSIEISLDKLNSKKEFTQTEHKLKNQLEKELTNLDNQKKNILERPAENKSKAKPIKSDFDNTLFDNKTGSLTPLGEEMKQKIANGEDITILTARENTPENKAFIAEKLGISPDKIKLGLNPQQKADNVNVGDVFFDDNQENIDAVNNKFQTQEAVKVGKDKETQPIETDKIPVVEEKVETESKPDQEKEPTGFEGIDKALSEAKKPETIEEKQESPKTAEPKKESTVLPKKDKVEIPAKESELKGQKKTIKPPVTEKKEAKPTKKQEVKKTVIGPQNKDLVFETDLNIYKVDVKDGKLVITPTLGNKKPSQTEINKVTEQYLATNNFDEGKRANLEGVPENRQDEAIEERSENAQEIAEAITRVKSQEAESKTGAQDSKNGAIAQALSGKQVDVNSYTNDKEDVSPSYFNKRNKTGDIQTVDDIRTNAQAQLNQDVSIEEVMDFMESNRSPKEFLDNQDSLSDLSGLEVKFTSVTGLDATDKNVAKVVGVEVTKPKEAPKKKDDDVPFQTESKFTKIAGEALTNLVDRLQRTGLSRGVKFLNSNQISSVLKSIGINNNVQLQQETILKAPNGKKSNLTRDQWSQVRTKAFKDWFGDWENNPKGSSKIVDENGEPLVVYHGTNAQFNEFKEGFSRTKLEGFYFTPFKEEAPADESLGDNVKEVFLNIRKLEVSNVENDLDYYLDFDKRSDLKIKDADGIYFKSDETRNQNEIVVFESNNIKSATDNIGSFSPESKDIRFQKDDDIPNGFVHNGVVYLNTDKVKSDTPIHEFGHLWNSYAKENHNAHYQLGLALIKDTVYHKEVKNNPAYAHLSEQGMLEEALAQAIGEKGVKIINESKAKKFSAWFNSLFKKIADGLGLTNTSGKALSEMTLDQYTDLVSAELLSGEQVVEESVAEKAPKSKVETSTLSNIELVMEVQRAVSNTKKKLLDKARDKKAVANDVKKLLKEYITENLKRNNITDIHKNKLNALLRSVESANTLKTLKTQQAKVDIIVARLNNIKQENLSKELKARELALEKINNKKINQKVKRNSLLDYLKEARKGKKLSDLSFTQAGAIFNSINNATTENQYNKIIDKIDALLLKLETKAEKTKAEADAKVKEAKDKAHDTKKKLVNRKRALRQYIQALLNFRNIPKLKKRQLTKLMNTVSEDIKNEAELIKRLDIVETILVGATNDAIIDDINALLNKKFLKVEGGRLKGKNNTTLADKVNKAIKANTVIEGGTAQEKKEKLLDKQEELFEAREKIYDKLDAGEVLTTEEVDNLYIYGVSISLINGKTATDVSGATAILLGAKEALTEFHKSQRILLKAQIDSRNEADKQTEDDWHESISFGKEASRKTNEDLKRERRTLKNVAQNFWTTITTGGIKFMASLDELASILDRKPNIDRDDSAVQKTFNEIKRGEIQKSRRIQSFKDLHLKGIKSIYGSRFNANRILGKNNELSLDRVVVDDKGEVVYVNAEGEIVPNALGKGDDVAIPLTQKETLNFTTSELLSVWQYAKNPNLLSGLASSGFTQEVLDEIDKLLPDSVKKHGELLFALYDTMYDDANEVYQKMYFTDMGKPDFYSGKVYRSGDLDNSNEDILKKYGVSRNTGYGSQKQRTINNKPIAPKDVTYLFEKHLQESSHFIAFAEIHRELGKLIKSDRIQKAIRDSNGGNANDIIITIEKLKENILERDNDTSNLMFLDILMRNIGRAILSLKPLIGIKQTASVVNGAFAMPTNMSLKARAEHFSPKNLYNSFLLIKNNSDWFQQRYSVGQMENTELGLSKLASSSSLTKNSDVNALYKEGKRVVDKARDYSMFFVKQGDKIGVMGALPVFSSWYNEYLKTMSPDEAFQKAIDKFDTTADRTQQTQTKAGKTALQLNPALRYAVQFASAPIQNLQNARHYRRQLVRHYRTNTAQTNVVNGLAYLNYRLAQPLVYAWVTGLMAGNLMTALGFGEEEPDDTDKDLLTFAILGNFGAIPIMGNILKGFVDKVILEKEKSWGEIMASPVTETINKLKQELIFTETAKTKETQVKHMEKAIKLSLELGVGFPVQLLDMLNGDFVNMVLNDEIDGSTRALRLLGASYFAIENSRKQRTTREKAGLAEKDADDNFNKTEVIYNIQTGEKKYSKEELEEVKLNLAWQEENFGIGTKKQKKTKAKFIGPNLRGEESATDKKKKGKGKKRKTRKAKKPKTRNTN